jgi:hypothetical protein
MPSPDLFNLLKKVWHKHGFSSTVTKKTLSLGAADAETGWYAKSYANTSIEMYIITKATRFMVLRQGLFFEYDGEGYTKDSVKEGDLILEPNGNQYVALSVCDRNILNQFRYNEVALKAVPGAVTYGVWNKWDAEEGVFNRIVRTLEMNSAASSLKTLFKLSLGSQDSVTGWYTPTYDAGSQIKCPILDVAAQTTYHRVGLYTFYSHVGYTLDDVFEGDVIKDFNSQFHRVREVKTVQLGDHLVYYELKLEFLDSYTVGKLGLT